MQKSIGVLIPTYNRPKDLDTALESIENQTYKPKVICILDNASSKETLDLLEKKGLLDFFDVDKIKKESFNFSLDNNLFYVKSTLKNGIIYIYVRSKENLGCSAGFHYGLKYLYENTDLEGFYILDDDAVLDENCLKEILPYINDYSSLSSLKLSRENKKSILPHVGYCIDNNYRYFPVKTLSNVEKNLKISFVSFAGWYLSRDLIEKAGYPKKDFFISNDDIEYSFRIKKSGLPTLLVYKSKIYHPSKIKENLPFYKYLFGFRNLSYIYKNYFIEKKNIKDKLLNISHDIFYKFIRIRYNFKYSIKEFYRWLCSMDSKETFIKCKNFKFNAKFFLEDDFIVFSSNSYLHTTQLYKHPNFKGAIYFEKGNNVFNIAFDNIIDVLDKNSKLKLLLQARDFFVYKLIGHLVSNNRIDLIDRIIV